jgi:uncharacterized protein (DUF1800 family)
MTIDPGSEAALALHRFGLGPRIGSIVAIAADSRGALLAELGLSGRGHPSSGTQSAGNLQSSGEVARSSFKVREARRTERRAERARCEAAKVAKTDRSGDAPAAARTVTQNLANADPPNRPQVNTVFAGQQQAYGDKASFRIGDALNAGIGRDERLTWFWSHHFCLSVAKNGVRPLADTYERAAIRKADVRIGDFNLSILGGPSS